MSSKTIAAGTADGSTLCDHLARSTAFVVLRIEDGRVAGRTVREWLRDECGHHAGFVEILAGCQAVLCGGIGQGAAAALAAHGIEPVVAAGRHTLEEAVSLYLAGQLATTTRRVCLCH